MTEAQEGRLRAVVAATLVLAACSGGERDRLTLGTVHRPAFALVFIAESKGYFAARGIAVVQRRFATDRDALRALAAGELDAATAYTTPVAIRAARDRLTVVTTLHASTRGTRLIARADRRISRAEDVAGKEIGVTVGGSSEYFLHTMLAYAGVEGAARVVDVAPAAAVDALVHGELDAIVSRPPHADRARRMLGPARTIEIGSDIHSELSVLVVREAMHQARRAALLKLVAALADAERLVQERPEEAFRALRTEFPEMSEAELRDTWGRLTPTLGVTHELAAHLEREAAWFRGDGRNQGSPLEVGRTIDPDVLAAVDPEAVTFVSPPSGKPAR